MHLYRNYGDLNPESREIGRSKWKVSRLSEVKLLSRSLAQIRRKMIK